MAADEVIWGDWVLRLDDNVIEQRHLVNRPTPNDVVVKYQGRFSGVEPGANPSPNP